MLSINKKEGLTVTLPFIRSYEDLHLFKNSLLDLLLAKNYETPTNGMEVVYLVYLLQALNPDTKEIEFLL